MTEESIVFSELIRIINFPFSQYIILILSNKLRDESFIALLFSAY